MSRPDPELPAASLSRRSFLRAGAAAGLAVGLCTSAVAEEPRGALPQRPFGRTGRKVSVFGLGTFPLGNLPDEGVARAVVHRSLEAGCTYFDTAPSYARGKSESRLGAALAEARARERVFLATKTHTRSADDARRDLEGSLGRLGVDVVDLVQVHAVKDEADLERVLGAGGPVEALLAAKDEGMLRHIGVTGHVRPSVVRAALERGPFEAALFPLNCVDPHHVSFQEQTLPAAVARGIARVAMKVFASGGLPQRDVDPVACLRYVYGLDISTAIVGCTTVEQVDLAVRVAREDRRLDAQEEKALLEATRAHAGPNLEWYKRV